MKDNRPLGMSQLDYLWVNFGNKTITSEISQQPSDDNILSEKAIASLIQNLQNSGVYIHSLMFDEDPLDPTMMRLTALSLDGSIITPVIRIPKEVHLSKFVGRTVTQVDVDNGCTYPVGSKILAITLTNGEEHIVSLEELNLVLTGGITDTIITEVNQGVVHSNLKIDRGNNTLSVVKLNKTGEGLYGTLNISSDNTGVDINNDNGALKINIPIGSTGYNLKVDNKTLDEYLNIPFKDPGTLYFISDRPYIYLGNRRYGVNIEPGDAPIVSLVYTPDTMTLAYKRSDESDIRLVQLGPVSEVQNGMLTKTQYNKILGLQKALDGIVDVKDYISTQVNTAGFILEWGDSTDTSRQLNLKNKYGDVISTVDVDKEIFLDFAESKKATAEDVYLAGKAGVTIQVGDQILILTLSSGDKIYTSINDLVDIYKTINTKSINLEINQSNELKADLNISEQDKILHIYQDGLAGHLQIVQSSDKVEFYGKTQTDQDKLGEIYLTNPVIKTIPAANVTKDIMSEYPPRYVDGKEYDRVINPINIGYPYLIINYVINNPDPAQCYTYNDYISLTNFIQSTSISPNPGNIITKDNNGLLYASLKIIDV